MSQQRLSVLSQHHLCAQGECLPDWLVARGWSKAEEEIIAVERWLSRAAAPGCTGGEAGRGKPLSAAALKWEGGLRRANVSCEEQKARLSLHHLSTFRSADETVRSPAQALMNYP